MQNLKNKIPALRFPEFTCEWSLMSLKEFAPLQRGFDLPVEKITLGEYPVVFSNGILKFHNEYKAVAPGIVTGRSGTIGKVTYVEKNYWPHNTALWVTNFKNNYPKFIFYFYSNYKLERLGTGSGVPTLNRNDVHIKKELFPSINEQIKIASFLTSVDEKLTQLKQKKTLLEQYKKGIMQKIFSHEIRFKDENGSDFPEWEVKTLGAVAEFYKGKGLSKNDLSVNGRFKCLLYGELFTKYNELITNILSRTDIFDNPFLSASNDVLMPTSDVTPNGLATASCIKEDGVILGGDVLVIRQQNKVIEGLFLSYYIAQYRDKVMKLVSGSTVYHLYGSDMKKLEVSIPCIQEQTKIANFLSAIDEKINHCNMQIVKLEQWKKGLLQQMFC